MQQHVKGNVRHAGFFFKTSISKAGKFKAMKTKILFLESKFLDVLRLKNYYFKFIRQLFDESCVIIPKPYHQVSLYFCCGENVFL